MNCLRFMNDFRFVRYSPAARGFALILAWLCFTSRRRLFHSRLLRNCAKVRFDLLAIFRCHFFALTFEQITCKARRKFAPLALLCGIKLRQIGSASGSVTAVAVAALTGA